MLVVLADLRITY